MTHARPRAVLARRGPVRRKPLCDVPLARLRGVSPPVATAHPGLPRGRIAPLFNRLLGPGRQLDGEAITHGPVHRGTAPGAAG